MIKFLVLAVALTACSHDAPQDTTPMRTVPDHSASESAASGQVSPEVMDQIQRSLDRKRDVIARCLGEAIDNKELPKGAHGKVGIELVIAPSGRASSVTIIKSDLASKALTDCVIHHVQEIQFPAVPSNYERSYTYGFEAS